MAGFSWLHITDLHAGTQDQEWLWPNLREDFYRDIGIVFDMCGGCDLVIFTGDLTQTGSPSDFDAVSRILEDLWGRFTSLGLSPLLATVPGNHDLMRPDRRDPVVKALAQWHSDAEIRDEFWRRQDSPYRQLVEQSFANYARWLRDLAVPQVSSRCGLLPGDFSGTLSSGTYTVGLIGLNTAFLQLTDENYQGRLDVGIAQLYTVCEGDVPRWCDSHDLIFLLSHHPSEWLFPAARERFRADIDVPGRFFSHLCGHLHEPKALWISEGGTSPRRVWQGPSLFGLRYYRQGAGIADRTHGYLAGRVDADATGSTLKLWPRRSQLSHAGHLRLVPDHGFELCDDGAVHESFVPKRVETAPPPIVEEIHPSTSSISLEPSDGSPLGTVSDRNLVERPPNEEVARGRLGSVPRWRLRPAPAHLAVRVLEQQAVARALSTDRAVWIVADWGVGKEEFLNTVLLNESRSEPGDVFRISCEALDSVEGLHAAAQQQLGISLQELSAYLAALSSPFLILDDVPESPRSIADLIASLEERAQAILDMAPPLRIVLTSRRSPGRSRFSAIQLRPLDEPDSAKYIAAHPDGGPGVFQALQLEQLYRRSEGIPMHLDRMLKALRVISIDELSEVEPEGIPPAGDPVPRALVQSVALLQTSLDRFTRRSLRLLKILTVLSQGEVFSVVRRFDQKAPFYPENIQELQDRGLLETVPFTTTAPELPSSAGVTMFDASSPKLLVIPRQVRDYVQSIMDEDERRAIVERALEVYFGPRWREGEAKLPPTTRLRIREGSIGGTGNAHIVAVWLFRDALQRRDLDTSRKIVRLTETYLEALLDADRYRDVYLAAQEVFHLVEVSDLKPQTARIAALAGRALRMTGNQDEAIKLLEKALEYATPELGKRWQSYVYLNLALAHESAGDINAAITAATQVEGLAEPHSAVAYQARSVLLECRAGENWDASSDTYRSLAKLERDARAKDYYVVANNIALTLAERTKSQQAKAEARERVLRTREDVYNRIRAVVDKANDLQATGRHSEITPREQRFLAEAYSYLYSQRFVSLFDRCHRVLWRMFKQEHKAVLLLRLFRFSSFIWRIYGKTRRERDYLRELQAEYPPSLLSSSEAIGSDEMGYYVARTRAIEGTGSQ